MISFSVIYYYLIIKAVEVKPAFHCVSKQAIKIVIKYHYIRKDTGFHEF